MANIDDPKHAHHIKTAEIAPGAELNMDDPDFHKAQKLVKSGHLTYTAVSATRTAENPDGSVVDRLVVDRTYNPNPAKK
jgi:hypothetical protein